MVPELVIYGRNRLKPPSVHSAAGVGGGWCVGGEGLVPYGVLSRDNYFET